MTSGTATAHPRTSSYLTLLHVNPPFTVGGVNWLTSGGNYCGSNVRVLLVWTPTNFDLPIRDFGDSVLIELYGGFRVSLSHSA
ncbi:hypothetical protein J6590_000204 [Homalodisca vitripennis]|nr:hypothetical protein J6590_000204 [Homalodisca vitripennis]